VSSKCPEEVDPLGTTFRLTRREFLASLPAAAAALGLEIPEELVAFSVLQPWSPA